MMKLLSRMALGTAAMTLSAGVLAAEYTMRLSDQYPPTHHVAKAIAQFARDVKENTGGKVEVQVYGSDQLFKATQNYPAVARGQVESAVVVSFLWGATLPDMQAMTIPFLMTSVDKLKKFPQSDAAKLLDQKMAGKGVRDIAWLLDANDGIFTSENAPLIKPEDFKGVKMRGLSKLFDNGLRALGAVSVAMPGSEVYQALQTGVVDGCLTGVDAAYARRFYEVQKYGTAGPLVTVYANLIVNPAWWDKLPPDLQKGVKAAAQKAEEALLPKSDGIAPEKIENLRSKGMKVTVMSAQQQKALADVMQPPVIEAFEKSTPDGKKLVEMIRKM
jgi:C4-dicarboxylate-binding protein DctP